MKTAAVAVASLVAVGAAVLIRQQAQASEGLLPFDPAAPPEWDSSWDAWGTAMRTVSENGLQLIRNHEGLRLASYQDPGGTWTVGYGHTGPDVERGMTITRDRAEQLLRMDASEAADAVSRHVMVPLSQAQFDALASLVYNIGAGAFGRSTLVDKLNALDYAGAAVEFSQWVYADGVRLGGLVARREREAALFRSGTVAL